MERRGYPLKVLHEYRMTPKGILDTIKYIGKSDIDELRGKTGTSAERMRLVPHAAEVLKVLVAQAEAPRNRGLRPTVSARGLLYEQMSEGAESARPADARQPAIPRRNMRGCRVFGPPALYRFVEPLFPRARPDKKRLIRAACLLS